MSPPTAPNTPGLDSRGLPLGYPFKPDWEITPRDAKRLLEGPENGRPLLLDCRGPDEQQVARIASSILVPMGEIERRAEELEDDGGERTRPIIVHCHHGVRSLRVTATLRALGFTDVRSMAGGIDLWSIDVDRAIPRY